MAGPTIRMPGGVLLVELLPAGGLGSGAPVRLAATQMVVRLPDGTPIVVAAAYGPDGCYAVSHAGDEDFNRVLRNLGLDITEVRVDRIQMPDPPPGARLIHSPD